MFVKRSGALEMNYRCIWLLRKFEMYFRHVSIRQIPVCCGLGIASDYGRGLPFLPQNVVPLEHCFLLAVRCGDGIANGLGAPAKADYRYLKKQAESLVVLRGGTTRKPSAAPLWAKWINPPTVVCRLSC